MITDTDFRPESVFESGRDDEVGSTLGLYGKGFWVFTIQRVKWELSDDEDDQRQVGGRTEILRMDQNPDQPAPQPQPPAEISVGSTGGPAGNAAPLEEGDRASSTAADQSGPDVGERI
ncbi:hypothetical protein NE237_022211 [Protea cynaroides]|uniref:Uncharacterized protein n=1 Tax=Protea cynaroides TaxID=273540 RepID=A0A9Q0H9B7_9MAGN|nr:hypothetical protein NE237_022211 [Protea cynaroides]